MVYGGYNGKEDSFIEQRGREWILGWRCDRNHIEFSNSLRNNIGIGVVIFSDFFREGPDEYAKGKSSQYEAKKGLLVQAGLWNE